MRLHDSASPFALTHNRHLHRTLLAMGVNFFAQMSGISVITFYSTTIFESDLGYTEQLPESYQALCRSGNSVVQVLLCFSSIDLGEDHFSLLRLQPCVLPSFFWPDSHPTLATTGLEARLFSSTSSLKPFPNGVLLVPFMYAAEVAPLRTRAQITALSAMTNWIFR